MSAAKHDLTIPRGEDYSFTLRILDSLDEPVALPPATSYGKAEVRESDRKPLAASFTITSLGSGTLKFVLTDTQTLGLDVNKKYKWDFFWFDTAGLRHKLLYGNVSAVANITNLT